MPGRRYLDQRLRLQMLRCADALALHGSVLKAAAALSVSQPAITKTLQDLEDIVGTRLFERHSRGVRATEAGEAVVGMARRLLAELRRADELLDQIEQPGSGTVALGALPVAASGMLPAALLRLRQTHPLVRVRLYEGRTEALLPLLQAGEIDLIVGRLYQPVIPDGLLREQLWDEPMAVLVRPGHPLTALGHVPPRALLGYDIVVPTISQRIGQEIDHILADLGGDPIRPPLRSESYGLIREMVLESDAVAIVPRLMLVGDLLRGTMSMLPLPVPAQPRPAGIISRPGHEVSPAAEAFSTALREHVRDLRQRGLPGITIPDTPPPIDDTTRRNPPP